MLLYLTPAMETALIEALEKAKMSVANAEGITEENRRLKMATIDRILRQVKCQPPPELTLD
jgi:hypothetical protein